MLGGNKSGDGGRSKAGLDPVPPGCNAGLEPAVDDGGPERAGFDSAGLPYKPGEVVPFAGAPKGAADGSNKDERGASTWEFRLPARAGFISGEEAEGGMRGVPNFIEPLNAGVPSMTEPDELYG